MPLFFIDITDRDRVHRDAHGSEVTDLSEASREAVSALIDLFRQGLDSPGERTASAAVRDGRGVVRYTATISFRGMNLS